VTDTRDDAASKRKRSRAYREPAVIDLASSEVRDDTPPPPAAAADPTDETKAAASPAPEAESVTVPAGTVPVPEASLAPAPEIARAEETGRVSDEPPAASAEPAPQAPSPSRSRAETHIVAGLLGGLIGSGLMLWGNAYFQGSTARLERRLGELEERAGAGPAPQALQAIDRRVAALEGETKGLSDRLGQARQLAEAAAAQARDAANRPATAAAPVTPPAPPAANPAVERAVTAVTQLETRLAALETQGRTASEQAGSQAQTIERRLADQDQRLGALARQVNEKGADAMAAGLRVVAADRLSSALRDGAPYAPALNTLRRFNADPARIAALEPYAGGGAPTGNALAQEFQPLSERILREARPADEPLSERFRRLADKVVTIRPVEQSGGDVQAQVQQIEAALRRGAFGEAATAFDALPEPARRTAESFGARLKQRAAAEAAARALATDTLSALDAATR
jgi:hypothetical protein